MKTWNFLWLLQNFRRRFGIFKVNSLPNFKNKGFSQTPLELSTRKKKLKLKKCVFVNIFLLQTLLFNHFFKQTLKYLFLTRFGKSENKSFFSLKSLSNFFNFNLQRYNNKNLNVLRTFNLLTQVKKNFFTETVFNTFAKTLNLWHYTLITRFVEVVTGFKLQLLFNPFLDNNLTFKEKTTCVQWNSRLISYKRMLGQKLFLLESLQILYLTLRIQDPKLILNWIRQSLKKLTFWKYKILIRYLKFILWEFFLPRFKELGMLGVKLKFKGKVGVAGNSRSRSYSYRIGQTKQSTLSIKTGYSFTYLHTFTGVIGCHVWLYF